VWSRYGDGALRPRHQIHPHLRQRLPRRRHRDPQDPTTGATGERSLRAGHRHPTPRSPRPRPDRDRDPRPARSDGSTPDITTSTAPIKPAINSHPKHPPGHLRIPTTATVGSSAHASSAA
jgi:hypothetical protein